MMLRWAVPEDIHYFYELRCDPKACLMSRRPAPTWEEHTRWWHESGDYRLVAEEDQVTRVGTLRVSPDGVVSIIVDPKHRGEGWGSKMLAELPKVMKVCGFKRLLAEVAPENEYSQKAFKKAGWHPVLWEVACE